MSRLLAALALAVTACAPEPEPLRCEDLGSRTAAATSADRKLLGEAAPYPADGTLRARADVLAASQRSRRELAWRVVERAIAPLSLAVEAPLEGAAVPRWRTWYDREDLTRLFHRLYEGLGKEGRAARAELPAAAIDEALGWNLAAVEDLDSWPAERWAEYVAALDEAIDVGGIGGIRRVALSPSVGRHLLESYGEILACRAAGAPPAFVDGPAEETRRLVREPLALGACASRAAGP